MLSKSGDIEKDENLKLLWNQKKIDEKAREERRKDKTH